MKTIKRLTAVVMAGVMMLSLAACSAPVKEYDEDSFTSVLKNDLKIDEDDINSAENHQKDTGYPDSTVVTAHYGKAVIMASFCKNADDAASAFGDAYDEFRDTFDTNNTFKGNSESVSSDGYGYIVVNGADSGTTVFGSLHRTGPIYAGIYYTGSMFVMIMPDGIQENGGADDDVKALIDAFGFPNA